MSLLLDTDVAIHVRDGQRDIIDSLTRRSEKLFLSTASLIELIGGSFGRPELVGARQAGLRVLLAQAVTVPFDEPVVERYGSIVETAGFSRKKVFDRLIAATAIVHDLTLVTINGADFRDIAGLKLDIWAAPAQ